VSAELPRNRRGARPLNVFITGASSGIGAALVRRYAREGAVIGLVARREDKLNTLVASLPTHAPFTRARYGVHVADVNDPAALREAALAHMRNFGCPDIVIASAGISVGTLTELQEDLGVFEQIVQTNLMGMVATFQPFLEAMKAKRRGTLVALASVAGLRGLPGAGAYSASKAAVIAYAESLRLEMRHYDVRVVTLAPGYIATPMTRDNPYPMPFLMQPDDFADAAVKAIAQGARFKVIPWRMGVVAAVLRLLPDAFYDLLFSHAPRKPRIDLRKIRHPRLTPRGSTMTRQPGARDASPDTIPLGAGTRGAPTTPDAVRAAIDAAEAESPAARVQGWGVESPKPPQG